MPDYQFSATQFSVDRESRTISGLVVPFGVKPIDGRSVVFKKDEIGWSNFKNVKINLDHNPATSFGYGLALAESDAGIEGTFKVADGPRGDEALALAESGVYDGLSVSLYKPDGKDKYHLAHVALLAEPAFDEARVTKIAASAADNQKEGAHVMGDQNENETPALDFGPVVDAIKEGFAALNTNDLGLAPGSQERPTFAGEGVTDEPSPYRFDGLAGEHDFGADVFGKSGHEGKARADQFVADQFAPVARGDVTTTMPTYTRPELFVNAILKPAPVFAAFDKGNISNGTPFIVPKYGSDSGMVADHTAGTEPTEGAYTTTSATVTPKAVSGLMKINREVLDAIGTPQVSSLVWARMLARYGEKLETEAAATVNGATLTELGTALPIAEADSYDVAADLENKLISAVFIDGSEEWDVFLGHQDLFTKVASSTVSATDLTKRYALLAPTNSQGSVSSRYRRINVGGYDIVPAGSLGATNVNGKSIIGAASSFGLWASSPQRIDFEQVAYGSIGLFGYYGGQLLDSTRVRKSTYNESAAS